MALCSLRAASSPVLILHCNTQRPLHRPRETDCGMTIKPLHNRIIEPVGLDYDAPLCQVPGIAKPPRRGLRLTGCCAWRQQHCAASAWRDQANAIDSMHRDMDWLRFHPIPNDARWTNTEPAFAQGQLQPTQPTPGAQHLAQHHCDAQFKMYDERGGGRAGGG